MAYIPISEDRGFTPCLVKTGGVVGINLPDGLVNECTGNADIKSEYRAGEVVGWNEGTFN